MQIQMNIVLPSLRLFPLEPATYSSPESLERFLSQLASTQPNVVGLVRPPGTEEQLYAVLIQDPYLDDKATTDKCERELLEHLVGCRFTFKDIAGSDSYNVATAIRQRMFDDDTTLGVIGIMPKEDKRHYAIFVVE